MIARLSAALVLLALVPRGARADVIMADGACPPGAMGRNTHEGFRCVPAPCNPTFECERPPTMGRIGEGRPLGECREWRVCTREARIERELGELTSERRALVADMAKVMVDASICGLGHTAASAVESALALGLIGGDA